jgi:hypothetical protein
MVDHLKNVGHEIHLARGWPCEKGKKEEGKLPFSSPSMDQTHLGRPIVDIRDLVNGTW